MKRLYMIIAGLLMVLGFLVPAVLSQGGPHSASTTMGTAIRGGSHDAWRAVYDGIGGSQGGTPTNGLDGAWGNLMNRAQNPWSDTSTGSARQSFPGGSGLCMDIGGYSC